MALRGNDSALLLAALRGQPRDNSDAYAQAMMHQADSGVIRGLNDGSVQAFSDILGQRNQRMGADLEQARIQQAAAAKQADLEARARANADELKNKLDFGAAKNASEEKQAEILARGRVDQERAKPRKPPTPPKGGGAKSDLLKVYEAAIKERNSKVAGAKAVGPPSGSFGANQRAMMDAQQNAMAAVAEYDQKVIAPIRQQLMNSGISPEEMQRIEQGGAQQPAAQQAPKGGSLKDRMKGP